MVAKKDDLTPDEMRDDILDAVLVHVPFDGWSGGQAISNAANDLGLTTGYIALAFPRGAIDMIDYHLQRTDQRMLAEFDKLDIKAMRIRDRIRTCLEVRLRLNAAHKEAVQRTVTFLALPFNAELSARTLWRTADLMWRAAGDTASDYNHYTKRMILSGVYASSLLVWLQDDSEDMAETMAFVDRRIDNVMQFEKFKAKALKARADVHEKLPDIWSVLGRMRYMGAGR